MKLAALVAASATLVLTPSANATTRHVVETAVEGNVEAVFSFDFKAPYRFTKPHLTIRRGGAVRFDGALKPLTSDSEVVPERYFDHQKSLAVRNLDLDAEPEVVLDLYSGGAHCCWYTEVYRYSAPPDAYLRATHIWGNTEHRTADLDDDGLVEFVSRDDRFAYEFTSFAYSSFPVQIWSYRAGRFVDVTRRFPARIRRDGRRQWHWGLSRQYHADNSGFLAAWTADQCLLRHCTSAFRQLDVLGRQGRIRLGWDKTPRRYLHHLRRFLRRTGYLP
jgi:hypothetical protein